MPPSSRRRATRSWPRPSRSPPRAISRSASPAPSRRPSPGCRRALKPEDISLVSVSTTLATNAVVEGHGSAVGVILIGFDQAMAERTGIAKAFPGMPIAIIAGGHDHNGDEAKPLDVAALEVAIGNMPVDAFAIASAFAVRNPAHEQRARELVAQFTGKPATLSTELTSALDAPRRALTAVLNARLISRVSHADRRRAAFHGGAWHRLPADDREGRRHAGAGRTRGPAAHRNRAVGPRRQPRRRLVAVRARGFHHVRHGRHHDRSRRAGRWPAAGGASRGPKSAAGAPW